MRRGIVPSAMYPFMDLAEDYLGVEAGVRTPGKYCLPGYKGCPLCGETYEIEPIRQRQIFVRCSCENLAFWDLDEAKDFIRVQ